MLKRMGAWRTAIVSFVAFSAGLAHAQGRAIPAMAQPETVGAPDTIATAPRRVEAAREFPRLELFFGFAYANVNLGSQAALFHPSGQNYNGVQLDSKLNFNKHIGAVMDLGGEYGASTITDPLGHEPKLHITTIQYLLGPEFTTRGQKVDVFAHTLVGFTRTSLSELKGYYYAPPYAVNPDYADLVRRTSLAFGVGGGIEKNWRDFAALRLIELDYIPADVNGNWQSTIRAATGVTVRF